MILSIKNGGYAFLIRLDLMFSMSLWKEVQLLQILNDLSIRHLIDVECWNLHDGTFLMFLSSWKKWTLKISLLVMYEILRLFFNTMTGDGKYFLRNSKNLPQPGQM